MSHGAILALFPSFSVFLLHFLALVDTFNSHSTLIAAVSLLQCFLLFVVTRKVRNLVFCTFISSPLQFCAGYPQVILHHFTAYRSFLWCSHSLWSSSTRVCPLHSHARKRWGGRGARVVFAQSAIRCLWLWSPQLTPTISPAPLSVDEGVGDYS